MKKSIILSLVSMLVTLILQAQTPETLTNSSVIRMSNANLSDELIIDMIRNSELNFDLSDEGLKNLSREGVSTAVMDVMKKASGYKNPEPPVISKPAPAKEDIPVADKPVREVNYQAESGASPTESEILSLEALNYVVPLTELIRFNETEFKTLEVNIAEWNKQVLTLVADVNKVKDQMLQVEGELREMKNADTKAFSADILELKKKLDIYRKSYQQSKEIMIDGGQKILKKIEAEMTARVRDIVKAYSSAGQMTGSSDTDPSGGEKVVEFNYQQKTVSQNPTAYMVYANDMLYWYRNEMAVLATIIHDWNPRVRNILQEDEKLRRQLDPLQTKLEELKSNPKLNKDEISSLKKQVSEIEKGRKRLADQMKDDARELASQLKQLSQRNQDSVKERFVDIIENITYAFGEKLGL